MSESSSKKIFGFRFTHIENIEWILANGITAINSPNKCPNYKGIGDKKIIIKRAEKEVPVAPYGVLNDYVPFYFASRSPMLYLLTKTGKAFPEELAYVVTSLNKLEENQQEFVFTDGHALIEISSFYNDKAYLKEIDWDIMKEKMWNDTLQDNDRQRRREAELLIKDCVLPHSIIGLAGFNEKVVDRLKQLVKNSELDIPVALKPMWYY